MSGPSDYEEKRMLDWSLDQDGYLGLFTTVPADDGTGGVEVTIGVGSYQRVHINNGGTQFAAAVGGAPSSKVGPTGGATWVFAVPTGNWGDTLGWGIFDASSGGNLRWSGTWTSGAPITINNGDPALTFNNSHQITAQAGDPTDPFT